MSVSDIFAIDLEALAEWTGAAAWERGRNYAKEGRIEILSATSERVTARARGTDTYDTRFTRSSGELEMYCSCPAFAQYDGACKHLVALAMTLASPSGRRRQAKVAEEATQLRSYLLTQTRERLVDLLLDAAEQQPVLMQRLDLQARTARADPSETAGILKKAITAATRTGGFVDHRRMADWTERVAAVIDQLQVSLEAGPNKAKTVLNLVPYLVERLEMAAENCDDDGHLGLLFDRTADLLIDAARAAKPDGKALATLLFRLDMDCDYFETGSLAESFGDLLGKAGLAAYREAVEAEWKALKVLRPDDRRNQKPEPNRFRLTQRRLALAEVAGDVDAQIETLSKTLVDPHDYVDLASLCLQHGRTDQALASIEEALWVFQDDTSGRLVDCAAEVLALAGQQDRALGLLWDQFVEYGSLSAYTTLTDAAAAAGCKPDYACRAVRWLEEQRINEDEEVKVSGATAWSWHASPGDTLVEVHLAEGRLDLAWGVAARGGISTGTQERLARASEADRPADAADIYQNLAEGAVAATNRQSYQRACSLVPKIQALRKAAGQSDGFATWLDGLRRKHKAKRSFIALLNEIKLQ